MFKNLKITKSWYVCFADYYAYDWKPILLSIEVIHKEYKNYEIALSWWKWSIRAIIYKDC